MVIEPHKWLRGWPEWNSRWRTAAILQNVGNAITRLSVDRFGWNLGGRIPSRSRHVHRDAVAMATADRRCLATAHWTFSSYGRLETECVNQFWWNLVHNSKLGPQWQSRNQILFFFNLKWRPGAMLENFGNAIHNSPTNGPTGTKLGWSHPITFLTCPPWCGCHDNVRCLATAHWTFFSYECLEAERLNQFWWNLIHDSKLKPKRQWRDQILKLLKFKMAYGRHVVKYWKYHNSPPNGLFGRNVCGRIPSCSRHVHHDVVAMATSVA